MERAAFSFLLVLVLTLNLSAQERPTLGKRDETGNTYSSNTLDAKLEELTRQIVTEMTENRKRVIAIVEFVDLKGNITDFGRFLSEELITRLYQSRKFKVIERQMLNKIISEQKLILTGAFDQSSVQRLGRLLGVDSICSGSITELARSLRVNARLIGTETGEVFAVASTEITKDESVLKLLGGTTSNQASDGTSNQSSVKERPVHRRPVTENFFAFDMEGCKQSGSRVICDLTITNQDKDRELWISGATLFDDFGNQSDSNGIRLANKTGYQVSNLMVSGIPVKARIAFDGVSAQATKITLLTLYYSIFDHFQVQFRNIPITK